MSHCNCLYQSLLLSMGNATKLYVLRRRVKQKDTMPLVWNTFSSSFGKECFMFSHFPSEIVFKDLRSGYKLALQHDSVWRCQPAPGADLYLWPIFIPGLSHALQPWCMSISRVTVAAFCRDHTEDAIWMLEVVWCLTGFFFFFGKMLISLHPAINLWKHS